MSYTSAAAAAAAPSPANGLHQPPMNSAPANGSAVSNKRLSQRLRIKDPTAPKTMSAAAKSFVPAQKDVLPTEDRREALYKEAKNLLAQNHLQQALDKINDALAIERKYSDRFHSLKGIILRRLGRYAEAIEEFHKIEKPLQTNRHQLFWTYYDFSLQTRSVEEKMKFFHHMKSARTGFHIHLCSYDREKREKEKSQLRKMINTCHRYFNTVARAPAEVEADVKYHANGQLLGQPFAITPVDESSAEEVFDENEWALTAQEFWKEEDFENAEIWAGAGIVRVEQLDTRYLNGNAISSLCIILGHCQSRREEFADALASIEKGLFYAKDDPNLLLMKEVCERAIAAAAKKTT